MPSSKCVYRYYDTGARLLYVGVSLSPIARLRGHAGRSEWIDQVSRIEIERFADSRTALDAEKQAIQAERPIYNVAYSRKPPGRTPAKPLEETERLRLLGIWKSNDYDTNADAIAAMGKGWSVSKAIKTFGPSGRVTGRRKVKT